MATPVIMPKQGQSVETCVITTWFRQKGDTVKTGEILCSYETDKASFDLESPADGIVLEIFFSDGDEVPVLENIAVIGKEGEETEPFRPGSEKTAEASVDKKQDGKEKTNETPVTTGEKM
ncbi:MAG TPA: lipoyl domain-containing protein, partial [Bacteroidales bacterium]|nr:lipoyl domain-containing protein [Bacteroidales bacterium]